MTDNIELSVSLDSKKKYKRGRIRDKNQELILNAAREEFVLKGYEGASIQAIADKAGIAKANVHYYFKRKANIYVAVLDEIIDLWNDYFDEIEEDDDPSVVLDKFIRQKVELSYSHPQSSKLFAREMISGAPRLRDYMRNKMRPFVRKKAEVMEQWIAQGKMLPVDPTLLIFLIWSSTQHYADFDIQVLTIMNRAEYEREMIDEIANFLSATILRGVGLTPPVRGSQSVAS
ncbi:TetR/AcrR family transcriptional regulator [Halioxenophilus sp. WMMB6]|uniref:TetR/AcrR family transcriptional regulator n=1 Tax=Halioxenophilus sp. WMMB6 TaxID=3073815 RepID=UPI00295F3BE8|nr:TetR/AcrR family transcriptional regulator [Halioxenophilus sp. WMMB6]